MLLSNDFYCTTELPECFDFSGVLKYAAESVGGKSLKEWAPRLKTCKRVGC